MPIPSASTPIEGIVWPSITARGVPGLANLIRSLQASQWLSAEELERNALRQLAITARHCARESPFFAERLKQAGLTPNDIARPSGLSALPPMTRRHIQEAGEDLFEDVTHINRITDGQRALATGAARRDIGIECSCRARRLGRPGDTQMTNAEHQGRRQSFPPC